MRLSNKVFPCISIFICFRVKYYNLLSAGDIKRPWRVGQLKLWGGRPWSRQTVCLNTSCTSTNFRFIQLVLQETQLSEWDKCISMLREHVFISINCWKVEYKDLDEINLPSESKISLRVTWSRWKELPKGLNSLKFCFFFWHMFAAENNISWKCTIMLFFESLVSLSLSISVLTVFAKFEEKC